VPGVYTGVPFFDLTSGGNGEAELVGWQGVFKDGKTRTLLMTQLRPLLAGEPTVVITTDNRARMLRNRLAVLVATAQMVKAELNDPFEMTLDPKRLNPRYLTETQKRFLAQAREMIDDQMKLWVLDAVDGIQDFERGLEWLNRYVRPPYNCRTWIWDHLADVSYKGAQDWDAFKHIIKTLKTANQEWGTTGIPVNQKKEGGEGVRSHMGGAFPQALDYMYEPRTQTIYEKDQQTGEEVPVKVVDVTLAISRWGDTVSNRYIINPSSGLFMNPFNVPGHMKPDRDQLPYILARRGQWDAERDGDPYKH
jgi:hypothetical protein